MKVHYFLCVMSLGLILAGCQAGLPVLPGQAAPTSPPPTVTTTVVPTLTPLPTRTRTPTPTPAASRTPDAPAQPNPGQVLSAENIAQAQAATLTLPGYVRGIYWPEGGRLVLLNEEAMQEVNLVPLAIGPAVPIEARTILGISPDGNSVLMQRGDGGVHIWHRLDGADVPVKFAAAYFGAYSEDGKTIALGAVGKMEVMLLDAVTLNPIKTLSGFETAAPVYSAVPGPGAKTLAWVSRSTIQLQDVASGKMQAAMNFNDFITGLAFSPDGQWLLVAVDRGLLQAVYVGKEGGVNAVDLALNADNRPISPVFSADGKLAAAGMGNDVAVWETAGWKQVALLKQHQTPVILVSFSPDGKALVSIDDQFQLASWIVP